MLLQKYTKNTKTLFFVGGGGGRRSIIRGFSVFAEVLENDPEEGMT
jgi:hypothetical protein